MRVKAVTNIKYGGDWHFAGEEFDIRDAELDELKGLVEATGKPASKAAPEAPAKAPEAEKKPARRR